MSEQGLKSLWRGNNANLQRNLALISLRVTLYDRIKHYYAPLERNRYSSFSYYSRLFASSL
jgi:hypothetical protein